MIKHNDNVEYILFVIENNYLRHTLEGKEIFYIFYVI